MRLRENLGKLATEYAGGRHWQETNTAQNQRGEVMEESLGTCRYMTAGSKNIRTRAADFLGRYYLTATGLNGLDPTERKTRAANFLEKYYTAAVATNNASPYKMTRAAQFLDRYYLVETGPNHLNLRNFRQDAVDCRGGPEMKDEDPASGFGVPIPGWNCYCEHLGGTWAGKKQNMKSACDPGPNGRWSVHNKEYPEKDPLRVPLMEAPVGEWCFNPPKFPSLATYLEPISKHSVCDLSPGRNEAYHQNTCAHPSYSPRTNPPNLGASDHQDDGGFDYLAERIQEYLESSSGKDLMDTNDLLSMLTTYQDDIYSTPYDHQGISLSPRSTEDMQSSKTQTQDLIPKRLIIALSTRFPHESEWVVHQVCAEHNPVHLSTRRVTGSAKPMVIFLFTTTPKEDASMLCIETGICDCDNSHRYLVHAALRVALDSVLILTSTNGADPSIRFFAEIGAQGNFVHNVDLLYTHGGHQEIWGVLEGLTEYILRYPLSIQSSL